MASDTEGATKGTCSSSTKQQGDEEDEELEYYELEDVGIDDEVEFRPSDDDDDDEENEYDDDEDESNDDDEEAVSVLHGSMSLNDEGRIVYSGTWDFEKKNTATIDMKSDSEDKEKTTRTNKSTNTTTIAKTKNSKFKLKSKQIVTSNIEKEKGGKDEKRKGFDLGTLLRASKKKRHFQRTLLFDGFFFVADASSKSSSANSSSKSKRIKERDVSITFLSMEDEREETPSSAVPSSVVTTNPTTTSTSRSFRVEGQGCNEYGSFVLNGTYKYTVIEKGNDVKALTNKSSSNNNNTVICRKRYKKDRDDRCQNGRRKRKRNYDEEDNEHEDDYCHLDESTDYDEVIALNEEANMSVEELRKRYYTNNEKVDGNESNGAARISSSMPRRDSLDNIPEDDECGF